MMPTENAAWVGAELERRFGVSRWSFTLTATDANRWAIRLARQVTGRPKILVFAWCYHGSVDETFALPGPDGEAVSRPGNVGAPVPLAQTTRVVEFNDLEALEQALAHGDVAAVLMEPALTNIGIVLPGPATSTAAAAHADERHAADQRRDPHVLGRPRRGHARVGPRARHRHDRQGDRRRHPGRRLRARRRARRPDRRARRHRPDRHRRRRRHAGRQRAVDRRDARHARARAHRSRLRSDDRARDPLHRRRPGRDRSNRRRVVGDPARCSRRVPVRQPAPANGSDSAAAGDAELEDYLHLYMANRGVLITPFHNMALMSPATTDADVDRHTELFAEAVEALLGSRRAA